MASCTMQVKAGICAVHVGDMPAAQQHFAALRDQDAAECGDLFIQVLSASAHDVTRVVVTKVHVPEVVVDGKVCFTGGCCVASTWNPLEQCSPWCARSWDVLLACQVAELWLSQGCHGEALPLLQVHTAPSCLVACNVECSAAGQMCLAATYGTPSPVCHADCSCLCADNVPHNIDPAHGNA